MTVLAIRRYLPSFRFHSIISIVEANNGKRNVTSCPTGVVSDKITSE